jgi:hypothetical protein
MGSAHVPELCIENKGHIALLALDGDEVVGGRQNRIFNASMLLGHGETKVPVSCVEEGRWRETKGSQFTAGERLPHGLRHSSHAAVGHSLHSQGGHVSDQRAIWRDIESGHRSHHSRSDTAALSDWYAAQKDLVQAYQEALPYPDHALGMVVGLGGQWVGCDLFDQADTARHYWPRLVRACAPEAARSAHLLPTTSAQAWLDDLHTCRAQTFDSPGLGLDVRLQGPRLTGSALVYAEVLVHLSLFTKEGVV